MKEDAMNRGSGKGAWTPMRTTGREFLDWGVEWMPGFSPPSGETVHPNVGRMPDQKFTVHFT